MKKSVGRKSAIVDFLVTGIAHFRFAYTTLFVRKQGTKRSFLPSLSTRVQGAELGGERQREENDAGRERVYEVTRRNKYNIMQTGEADRAWQSLGNLGNPE